ncbi:MAG: hypothetical protein IJZ53_06045 [Tyzzerella sp.]|nr:hypothetical protein [Tyzzerella sp.]
MIALALTEVKECMGKLLLSETFDPFYFIEGEIVTFGTFTMDGYLKKEFFENEDAPTREYALWKDMREYCFSLIKGKRTPLSFKFVLGLSDSNIEKLLIQQELDFKPADVRGLYINLKFDGQKLQCVTGTAMNLFTMDKSLEQAWDKMVQKFFTQKEIKYEVL